MAAASPALAAAPVIDSFVATPTTVAPGELSTLTVSAHDPDCPGTCTTGCGLTIRADLTLWTATGGTFESTDNGTTGSPYSATTDWRAPAAEGTYTITVDLSDSGTFVCGGRQTTSASLDVQVTTIVGQPPVIQELTARPAQVFPGDSSALDCRATDPDGDPITYSWASDLGTVTPGAGGAALLVSDQPGLATVTCTATDPFGLFATASIPVSITGAVPEKRLRSGLSTPGRLDIDSTGEVYVVDNGGLTVVHLSSGELVYHLPMPGVEAVAVGWNGNLLVGGLGGARVVDRRGRGIQVLNPGEPLGAVSDVAVDPVRRRWVALYPSAARVVVYDAAGNVVGAFGSAGGGPAQLSNPQGVAVTPAGELVVADSGHGQVKIFDLAGNLLSSFGGLGNGAGEFIRLHDVAVDGDGLIYTTDTFQSWVQVFNPDGTLREVLGTYGDELGQLKTPAGVAPANAFDRLLVASLNASSLQVFLIAGDAPPVTAVPVARLSDDHLDFGSVPIGAASPRRVVTLTNTGDAPLGVRSVRAGGDFSQGNNCGLFVDPGASCTFHVTFTPTAVGPRTGSLVIDTSAAGGDLVVGLSGEGFVPGTASFSLPRLRFADQRIGTVSPPQSVVLTNIGTAPLALVSIGVSGEFTQVNDCRASLPAGASCTLTVRFSPVTADDDLFGALTVYSGSGGQSQLPLFGSGVARLLSPIPGAVVFEPAPGGTAGTVQTVTVANTGNMYVDLGPLVLEGGSADRFLIEEDGCSGIVLRTGGACTFRVAFLPGARGESSARVAVPSNAFNGPVAVELIGRIAAPVEIPTLQGRALALLALLLAGFGLVALRGRIQP